MSSANDEMWRLALQAGVCPKGCDLHNNTCEHLDAYLSRSKSVATFGVADFDKFMERLTPKELVAEVKPIELTSDEMEVKLKKYGLQQWEVLILIENFYNNLTYAQIAAEHGFINAMTVFRIKKLALEKLKNNGFAITKTVEVFNQ